MTISSLKHAEATIRRMVRKGPVGDESRVFLAHLFNGRRPSDKESEFAFQAIENLEVRKEIHVTREPKLGVPIMIDQYDCSKEKSMAIQESNISDGVMMLEPKRILGRAELLVVLHEILRREAKDGKIQNGKSASEYITHLHREVSRCYEASYGEVDAVFGLMAALDLRGNVKSLRGMAGMPVSDVVLTVVTDPSETEREYTRLTAEVADLLAENERLTTQNDALEERNVYLDQRVRGLTAFRDTVDTALGKVNRGL